MVQDGGHDLRAAEAVSSAGQGPLPERAAGQRGAVGGRCRPPAAGRLPESPPGAAGRVSEPRALPAFLAGRSRP